MEKLIAWVEIPTTNFDRAVKFYNSVLGLDLKETDCGNEKMACFPGGEGAIISSPGYNPSNDGTMVSFCVGNRLSEIYDRIESLGGKAIRPKTKIDADGRGYFAVIEDCEGNKVGLYQD